jgi:predicted N-acetyltransferase YhbS
VSQNPDSLYLLARSSSMKEPASGLRLPIRRGSVEYTLAGEADHEAIYQTLLHVFHGPDRDTFLGALADPDYRPEHRLVAKIDGRVAAHVHLTERTIRYGVSQTRVNGVLWVGTLPEFRGLGFAQNLVRLADHRTLETGAVVQALTTTMPRFYQSLGWGVCGRTTVGVALSRNLPAAGEAPIEGKGGAWMVRPWRQVELNDLMDLYDAQFARTTGTVLRSEDYWRWMIGRRYAHVIWVACQGETVRGYAFVKDHRVLEIASDPAYPYALKALLGRVRAEALERAYPQVILHAPTDHPAMEYFRNGAGRVVDQDEYDGQTSMYHIPDPGRFLSAVGDELVRRVKESGAAGPVELGLSVNDRKWLVQVSPSGGVKVEPDKLGRRYLTLTSAAFVRLAMGHTGIDAAVSGDGAEASTHTAVESARILFPPVPIWRSPLDAGTA